MADTEPTSGWDRIRDAPPAGARRVVVDAATVEAWNMWRAVFPGAMEIAVGDEFDVPAVSEDDPYNLDRPAKLLFPTRRRKRSPFDRCGGYGYGEAGP